MRANKLEEKVIFLFDVDGVIANTPHEKAWKAAAIEWGIISETFNFAPFYVNNVAGQLGITGARNILELLCEENKPTYYVRQGITDPKQKDELANKFRDPLKKKYLDQYISDGKFNVFDDIVKIIFEAKNAGVPIAAASSSEHAESILKKINAVELSKKLKIPYTPQGDDSSLYSVFDTTILGSMKYWHEVEIEKINHYAMAYGKILGTLGREESPYVVVFDDAPKGVAALNKLGFICIGISRKHSSGIQLATKKDLLEAGAKLAYTERELETMDYQKLRPAIIGLVPEELL